MNLCQPKGGEHGCRVCRGHDGAEKERFQPREPEQRMSTDPGHCRRDDDADGAQQRCGRGDLAEPAPGGLQTPLVKDQPEADDSDPASEVHVVEFDPARAVRTQQHAEPEERDQNGKAAARGAVRSDHAGPEYRADDEKQEPLVHGRIFAARRVIRSRGALHE